MFTNEEVCAKIQQAIRPHVDLLTKVKRLHKLKAIAILQGTEKVRRRQGKAHRKIGGKTTSVNGQAWSLPKVPEGSGEQRAMEESGCEVICGASMKTAVKG